MNPADWLTQDGLVIYLFHGVVEQSDFKVRNYTGKHLLRRRFTMMMQQLQQTGSPMSMDDVVHHIESHIPFPSNAFAITFDDGFENNFTIAAPILRQYDIPSTFYVTTGFIDTNCPSWIDRIEAAMENAPSGKLQLPWECEPVAFDRLESRVGLLDEIRMHVKNDPLMNPDVCATMLLDRLDVDQTFSQQCDALTRMMSWDQIRELNTDNLFTIGGHSHTHRILSYLNQDELDDEISTSIRMLREKTGVDTVHYSYPEGLSFCYSNRVIDTLHKHGIICCPTARSGINRIDNDLFHLRRVAVL